VTPGQVIDVDLIDVAEGGAVELDRVLLIGDGEKVTIGTPTIEGAKVVATSKGEGKTKKIIVFRYKNKTRSRRKTGHRELYTRLTIDKLIGPGTTPSEPPKRVRRKKSEVTESGA
jgi:large subunit ribosomal protein L21